MIDTHCHIDSPRFGDGNGRREALEAAAAAGVTDVVLPGVYPATWRDLADFAADWNAAGGLPRLHPCFGIHPQALPELSDRDIADGLAELDRTGNCGLAIGECGLDGPTLKLPGGGLERQLEVFTAHLDAARRFGLPVLVHCLRTHDPLLKLLRAQERLEDGVVLHSYSGSAELVPQYLELNAWFSFSGPVSYAGARRPVAAAKAVPNDRLLIETDAPDQTPEPYRGQRNEPAFLPAVARALAAARNEDLEVVVRSTTENARRVLRLPV